MKQTPDVLILGAGIGGSALGALLACRGYKVRILERNAFVGGRCVSYRKEGFTIDVFVHMFGRCEKGPYGEILRRAGRTDTLRWWHASPVSKPLFFLDDEPYPHPDPSFSWREEATRTYRAMGLGEDDVASIFRIRDAIAALAPRRQRPWTTFRSAAGSGASPTASRSWHWNTRGCSSPRW